MRFCPFCSAENNDDLAVCQACGRRLPPLPPRAKFANAVTTGVHLAPRPRTSTSSPASGDATTARNAALEPRATMPGAAPLPASPPAPAAAAAKAPTTEPVELLGAEELVESAPADDRKRQLVNALSPSPAAQRRAPTAEPPSPRVAADRRRPESRPPLSPTALRRPPAELEPEPAPLPKPWAAPASRPSQPPERPSTTASVLASLPHQQPAPPTVQQPPPTVPPAPPTVATAQSLPTAPTQPLLVAPTLPLPIAPRRSPSVPPPSPVALPGPPAPMFAQDLATAPPPMALGRPLAPQIMPVPEVPEPGLVNAARYAYLFARARWQRRRAIRQLGVEIKQDTEALDGVLGALGLAARAASVDGRVFSAENQAISMAEERIAHLQKESAEVDVRRTEEVAKFVEVERERTANVGEGERSVAETSGELSQLEGQRRGLRDKRKELERRQRAYLKAAQDVERQSQAAAGGNARSVAHDHRQQAAALDPERAEIDRQLAALERPIGDVTGRLDAAKAELVTAKRSLNDAREGHTHRLAELDAEQKRKHREIATAEAEIKRRLVTLGTLVNLNRIDGPSFRELYDHIDHLRGAITSRTTEIEMLTAEREAYDRGVLWRGVATVGGALVILIALIAVIAAIA